MNMNQWVKVEVYYNLRKKRLSVRSRITGPTYGKVITHLDRILLTNATFHVSEPGRQRVIREQRKNVHAVIRGEVPLNWLRQAVTSVEIGLAVPEQDFIYAPGYDNVIPVTYNPYSFDSFVENNVDSYAPVQAADMVLIEGRRITACRPTYAQVSA